MNRYSRVLPVVGLLVIATSALSAQSAEPLRWKFRKGERLQYDLRHQTINKVDAGQRGSITTTMTQDMNTFWTVKNVAPEGNATIVQSFDRIQVKMEMPGGRSFEYDSDSDDPPEGMAALVAPMLNALTEAEFTLTMTPRGEVLDVEIPEKFAEAFRNAPGAQMMGDIASAEGLRLLFERSSVKFPEAEFDVGDTLTKKIEIESPGIGTQVVEASHTYKGTTVVAGEEYERFTPDINMSLTAPTEVDADEQAGPAPPMATDVKISDQTTTGELLFSREQGRPWKSRVEQQFTMDMNVAGQAVSTSIDQTIDIEIKPVGQVDVDE